jgi:carboxypeptidase C (cathepsin A)
LALLRAARRIAGTAVAVLVLSAPTFEPAAAADDADAAAAVPKERTVVTRHSAQIGGREISYNAVVGTIVLRDAQDKPTASVFYHSYIATGLGPTTQRPITFSYNGGPGGSSALVDVGAFGPRMVVTENAAQSLPPPYKMVDNADSILDKSDLVFIDAVGTGFSRLVGKGTGKDYYGVDEDGNAFAEFIRRYITTNARWNSPKYLLGESYGTTRSAVLAKKLEDRGIAVSGVTLMSTVLDFASLEGQNADDEPFWTFLPTFAATAAYYHKLPTQPPDLTAFLGEVRAFAGGPYLRALALGDALPEGERNTIAAQLHAYTGLPLDYILRSNLRIPPDRFQKVLLGGDVETVGRYDSRFHAFDIDPIGADADTDPSSDAVFGAFTAAFNAYVRTDLGYKTDDEYKFLAYDVNRQWDWTRGHSSPTATDVTPDLAEAMTADRYLRVLSVNGLYDLATPFFATETALHHLGIAKPLQANISFRYYPSGHMIYLNPVAHAALKRDLDAFYSGASH